MNIFKKITNSIVGGMMTQGIGQSYQEFVNQKEEFNTNILNCDDADFAGNIVNEFLKSNIQVEEHNDNGVFETLVVNFEDWIYAFHVFRHYAKVVMVSTRVNVGNTDAVTLLRLCNDINKNDKIHQVGYVQQDGQLLLEIKRQFMFTHSVGSVVTFKEGLRDLREYASTIIDNISSDTWKQYALKDTQSIRNTIKSAEQVWFPEEADNIIRTFTKKLKVIHETTSEKVHEMIQLMGNGFAIRFGENAYLTGSRNLPQMTITTYKDFPLLLTMQATISNENYRKINKEKALNLCAAWNGAVHFSLSRLVFDEAPNGEINISLIMSGLFGETLNTRTFVDYLGSMHKTIALLMGLKETK